MVEQTRQFVLFGDFNSITFDVIARLQDSINKYGLHISAAPDNGVQIPMPLPVQGLGGLSNQAFGVFSPGRPVLQTSDLKKNVFFGSGRLHIEEINQILESYDDFCVMAKYILKNIIEVFGVKIGRIAMNGQFICDDLSTINKLYDKTFSKSNVILDASEEWQYRINNITNNEALRCKFNNIISMNRIVSFDAIGKRQDVLSIAYDINTLHGIDKLFTYNDIETFCLQGIGFRTNLLQYIAN